MRTKLCYIWIALFFSCFTQNNSFELQLNAERLLTNYKSPDLLYQATTSRFLHPDAVNYTSELGFRLLVNTSFHFSLPFCVSQQKIAPEALNHRTYMQAWNSYFLNNYKFF